MAKWEFQNRAIQRLAEEEGRVKRALEMAELYADEYPSGDTCLNLNPKTLKP